MKISFVAVLRVCRREGRISQSARDSRLYRVPPYARMLVFLCLVMTFLRAKIAGQYDVHDPLKSRAMVSITGLSCTPSYAATILSRRETSVHGLYEISPFRFAAESTVSNAPNRLIG